MKEDLGAYWQYVVWHVIYAITASIVYDLNINRTWKLITIFYYNSNQSMNFLGWNIKDKWVV